MQTPFIDRYSRLESIIHKLNSRIKIIVLISFIFFVILTPTAEFMKFYCYFLVLFSIILLSKVPPAFIFKRSLVVVPFVFLVALFAPFLKEGEVIASYSFGFFELGITYAGVMIFLNVLMKSWLSSLSMIILVSTTTSPELLKGFERLKMPRVIVMIISFMYRYVFVIAGELMNMKKARDSRSFGGGRIWHIKTIGNMIAVLFIRSYERGERVYYAMLSRGFSGSIRTLDDSRIRGADVLFAMIIFLILTLILIS